MIAVVLIAPMVEEITFRGSITGGLRSRIGAGRAVVLSSAVSALAYTLSVGGSILLLGPSLFVAGAALAPVSHWTRSLHPGDRPARLLQPGRRDSDLPDQHRREPPLTGM